MLDDNGALVVDLANADLHDADGNVCLQRDSIYLGRLKFLCGSACYERIRIRRFNPVPEPIPLDLAFDADFADLFEVRGERRERRGTLSAEKLDEGAVRFTYLGLDEVERRTTIHFDPAPDRLSAARRALEPRPQPPGSPHSGDQGRIATWARTRRRR